MGDKDDGQHAKPKPAEDRRARLAAALRANLLKRKARTRARKDPETPPKEGGQTRG